MISQINSTSLIFKSHLSEYRNTFPQLVESVRGKGLLLGVQLKSVGQKSSSDLASLVVSRAREMGLLIITAGEGALRLAPPLNIPEEAVLQGLDILEEALLDVIKEM